MLAATDRAPRDAGGSVWVVSGRPGSGLLARAREVVEGEGVDLAHAEALPVARPDPHAPIVRVTYHGTAVAAGSLRGRGLCTRLPFAGGALDPGGFRAATYVVPSDAVPAVSTLVIVSQPRLSHLEWRALDRLSGEDRLAVGREPDAGASVTRLLAMRTELMFAGRLS